MNSRCQDGTLSGSNFVQELYLELLRLCSRSREFPIHPLCISLKHMVEEVYQCEYRNFSFLSATIISKSSA
jgi:hypothetical protein